MSYHTIPYAHNMTPSCRAINVFMAYRHFRSSMGWVSILLGVEGVRVRAGAGGGLAIQGLGVGSAGNAFPER